MLGERSARIYTPEGYLQSEPRDDGEILDVMRAVRDDGIEVMERDPGGDTTFSLSGLQVLLRVAGLRQPPVYHPNALPEGSAFLVRHPVPPDRPEPCGRLHNDLGIYLVRGPGNAVIPFEEYVFYGPRLAGSARW